MEAELVLYIRSTEFSAFDLFRFRIEFMEQTNRKIYIDTYSVPMHTHMSMKAIISRYNCAESNRSHIFYFLLSFSFR